MLVLTDNATSLICALAERPDTPDGAALRISSGTQDGPSGLAVSTVEVPEEGDQIVEKGGARVFLEPAAAMVLEDKVLDARRDESGRVQFLLEDQ